MMTSVCAVNCLGSHVNQWFYIYDLIVFIARFKLTAAWSDNEDNKTELHILLETATTLHINLKCNKMLFYQIGLAIEEMESKLVM